MSQVNLSDNKDVIVQNVDPNQCNGIRFACLFLSKRSHWLHRHFQSTDQFLSKYTVLYNYR